jgi:hypothetical protein
MNDLRRHEVCGIRDLDYVYKLALAGSISFAYETSLLL